MSVIKHTDPVPDPRAVNQDKKNMLFSVSLFKRTWAWVSILHLAQYQYASNGTVTLQKKTTRTRGAAEVAEQL